MLGAQFGAALVPLSIVLWRRAQTYRELANSYDLQVIFVDSDLSPAETEKMIRGLNDYHDLMHRKYDRAARYPWLPVAPDPPEPE